MDKLSFLGILLGTFAILFGHSFEGGKLSMLFNMPSFVIVVVGTFGAACLETTYENFGRAFKLLPQVFFPEKLSSLKQVDKVITWSTITRKKGLLGLEELLELEKDPFTKKGLSLLIDGVDLQEIQTILNVDLENKISADLQSIKLFESMGGYSPTMGIVGAVLGLIHVMTNLTDPSKLGEGIAVAFVATIYGVGLANLIYLPISNKLQNLIQERTKLDEILIEGISSISRGENTRSIQLKLLGFCQ